VKNEVGPMLKASLNLSKNVPDTHEKNRLWRESLPMIYEDWNAEEGVPENTLLLLTLMSF